VKQSAFCDAVHCIQLVQTIRLGVLQHPVGEDACVFADLCFISYGNGVTAGRIDIASGRVKATQVVNADGLTEWKFEEQGK